MKDVFVEREWNELCQHLVQIAGRRGAESSAVEHFESQAKQFCDQPVPQRYPELLKRVRDAAELAKQWQGTDESSQ